MIIFNEDLVSYMDLSALYVWQNDDEKIYRLFFIYFGLSSIGVGSFIFHLFCPDEIKNSPDEQDYVDREKRIESGFRQYYIMGNTLGEFERINDKINHIDTYIYELVDNLRYLEKNRIVPASSRLARIVDHQERGRPTYEDEGGVYNEYLRLRWWIRNVWYFKVRISLIILYITGWILLIYPTGDTFWRVCYALYLKS